MRYYATNGPPLCANSSSRAGRVVSPQCWKGAAKKVVTVIYNEVEQDSHDLCDDCAKVLVADAERHGYDTTTREL